MNQIKRIILCVSILCAAALAHADPAVAQPVPDVPPASMTASQPSHVVAPTTQSFVQTAEQYVSQFNTNLLTFSTNAPFELWTGVGFEQGLSVGALVGFDAKPIAKWPGLYLGNMATFAGVIGTVAADEVDAGYAIVHYDLEIKLFAGAVAQFANDAGNTKGMRGSGGTQWEKALTANSFGGIRAEDIFGGRKNELMGALIGGFTF